MSAPIDGRVIRGVDIGNCAFRAKWNDLPSNIQAEARAVLGSLILMPLDSIPAKLHMHVLQSKQVPSRLNSTKKVSVWTLHITASDTYKASFTLEDGVAYFRTCGKHDAVDKTP